MLLSYKTLQILNPELIHKNLKQSKNRPFFADSILQLKTSNGYRSKLELDVKNLVGKLETKHLAKWASYGGSIPSILKSLDTVDDLDVALRPWEKSLNSKERTIILKEQSNWKRALEIFEWFKRKGCYELNVIHYNIMLRCLGRARRWDLMGSLWVEMKLNKIVPTNSTYGTLIDAYSKGGLSKQSLIWLGEMYKQGIKPDEVTMAIVVQTYKKAREFQKAEEFFKRWSSVVNHEDSSQSHKCSLHTYNMMIDTYGKAGELKQASETFTKMLREGIFPDIVTFNTMIHVCGNHGCLEEVNSLLAMMEETRCFPDTRTYNILIAIYTKNDDINAASSCFSKMKANGVVPDYVSYRTLLFAFSIRNMTVEAEALVLEMGQKGLEIDEYTHSALTRMYIRVKMLESSWSWFERFVDKMSLECFAANIDAFGENGHLSLAENAFSFCLVRHKLSVLVFNVMIKAYGIGKEFDKACELFDSMENHGIFPDKCTYSSLIQILSSAELPHRAVSYLKKMQNAGLVSDCIPYSMVMASFSKVGELQTVEDIFREMLGFGLQPDIVVYSVLINGFAEIGSVAQATSYVKLMIGAGFELNSIICNSLIKLYTKVGYLQEAQEIFELFKALGDGPDVYSSNCMIDLYSENCMVREAEEVFRNLKRREEANEFSHAMMLCLYKNMGHFNEAYQVAQQMKTLGLLSETLSYNNVIGLYVSDGRMKDAVLTFHQMMASGVQPNDATFRLLGIVLIKRGASKDAIKHLELVRKSNVQTGLHEWLKALCSLVKLEDNFLQFGGKLNRHFDSVNPEQCSYG